MPTIPFAYQTYDRSTALQPQSVCKNLFVEQDSSGNTTNEAAAMLVQRPGLTRYQTLPANIRGFFLSENVNDNRLYTVAGNQLLAINGFNASTVGTVANDGQTVAFAPTLDKMAIASGGNLYTYFQDANNAGSFGQVAMPDGRPVIDITELNNYVIIACSDGRFYWILPGTNVVGALDFLTAESSTDGLQAVQRIGDEIYFFGTSSIEVWTATGDLDIPFIRSNGRNLSVGLLFRDTVQLMDNSVFWVGSTGYVYRASNSPVRVSTASIEEQIRKRTGPLSALVYTVEGHQFYCLKIPGRGTYCYDASTQKWCQFQTKGLAVWSPTYSTVVGADTLLASDANTIVWRSNPEINTDDGAQMERVATATIPLPQRPVKNQSFSMDVGCSGPCNWRLRWKDALEDDYNVQYQIMPSQRNNDRISLRRMNRAYGQYRTFEISIVDDVRVRFGDALANEAYDGR